MEIPINSPRSRPPTGPQSESSTRPREAVEGAQTIEPLVLQRLSAELGGLRGSFETAVPVGVLGVAFAFVGQGATAIVAAVGVVVIEGLLRLWSRSTLQFVRNGALALAIAILVASVTGRAEDAFLPGLIQTGLWVVVLGGSVLLQRPLGGYVVGAVLGDSTGWLHRPAVVRLGRRLTLVLLAPMIVRVAVQLPLYLAEEAGWLGVSRIALGWPLHAATLAAAGAVLLRGRTPLDEAPDD
ncbi:MAG: DUF3159 domain-containing protein [Nitriliruptoraceae bacterium]